MKLNKNAIIIDNRRDELLTDFAKLLLKSHYMLESETTPQETFARASICFSGGNSKLAQRLYDYVSKGWFMYSSPILSNAVYPGEKPKGMPISCFVTYVDDSIKGLCEHTTEIRHMSVKGGGVGGHWTHVRSMDSITPGPIGFQKTIDADMIAYKQGATRRGAYASYMNIDHPDIVEFIHMRTPTGELKRKSLNLHHGVNITDDFLDAIEGDKEWSLVDPHSLEIKDIVKARDLWETILTTRFRTGEPYINYISQANEKLHPALKAEGLNIWGSNLCNEIHLPTDSDRTGVCCLSSVNLAKYDEWKDTRIIEDLVTMLDNTLQFFIDNAPDELSKAVYSAQQERSIGLGAMGFHDYLLSKDIPLESLEAISWSALLARDIYSKAKDASIRLGSSRDPALLLSKHNYFTRNAHLIAIAPNSNSSILLGVSPGIDPRYSNAYTQKTRIGSYLVKTPRLEECLEKYGKNTEEVWKDIITNEGSVQHLDFLSTDEKLLFKTSFEVDQRQIVDLARVRQPYICQGQSVNLFFPNGSDRAYVNEVHLRAFREEGIGVPLKGLYYLRTEAERKTEKIAIELQRDALKDGDCINCEG